MRVLTGRVLDEHERAPNARAADLWTPENGAAKGRQLAARILARVAERRADQDWRRRAYRT